MVSYYDQDIGCEGIGCEGIGCEGILPLCRGAVYVLYSLSKQNGR